MLHSTTVKSLPLFALLLLLLLPACVMGPKRVTLVADGSRRLIETTAVTVQDLLREQNVLMGDNDRVEPPPFAEVDRSATVTVTRVKIVTEKVRQPIPFERRLVRDEAYPEGQMRILQLGANGEVEITYATSYENGQDKGTRETARRVVTEAKHEVLALGTLGSLPGVPLPGAVIYLSSGNAWVMRNSSTDKRPLTATGDLDGRVFSISADGRYLLFSRAAPQDSNGLTSLWLIDTLVLGELPRAVPVSDTLYAQIAGDASFIVYSTGEKTFGAPGWRAHNDLYFAALPDLAATPPAPITLTPTLVWKASQPAPYSWWGAKFALAPDGRAVAYGFANEVGFTEITTRTLAIADGNTPRHTLATFAPFRTRADWVWTPQVAWSADSRFVLAAVHAATDPPNMANDNPLFDVYAFARDNSVYAPLARQTGMWAAPAWSPPDVAGESQIAYGVALSPSDSERSRYALYLMDRDGGNKKQVFPQAKEDGLIVVQVAWAAGARQLVAIRQSDIWLYDLNEGKWSQLTANAATTLVRMGK